MTRAQESTLTVVYQVADWRATFENYKSREIRSCGFVCIPNKEHGEGLTNVLSLPDGAAIYGMFHLIVIACSRHAVREGWLTNNGRADGRPWTAAYLATRFRQPVEVVERALHVLASEEVGWLRVTPHYPHGLGRSPVSPPPPKPTQYPRSTPAVPLQYPDSTPAVPRQYPGSTRAVPVQYPCSTPAVPSEVNGTDQKRTEQHAGACGIGQVRDRPPRARSDIPPVAAADAVGHGGNHDPASVHRCVAKLQAAGFSADEALRFAQHPRCKEHRLDQVLERAAETERRGKLLNKPGFVRDGVMRGYVPLMTPRERHEARLPEYVQEDSASERQRRAEVNAGERADRELVNELPPDVLESYHQQVVAGQSSDFLRQHFQKGDPRSSPCLISKIAKLAKEGATLQPVAALPRELLSFEPADAAVVAHAGECQ